jgi:hypothetical protein
MCKLQWAVPWLAGWECRRTSVFLLLEEAVRVLG